MDYLNELIQVLIIEKKLYTKLTDLAEQKQKVIITNNVEKLISYLEQEQELIIEIEDTEKRRRHAVIGLCSDLDISDKELSFSKLRNYLDEPSKLTLDEFKTSLLAILERLHEINETNRLLIEEALKINDFTFRLLTQASAPQSQIYNKEGVDKNKSQHIIDKRA